MRTGRPSAGAAKFKGLVLLNARDFCVSRFGAAGWRAVVDALPENDRPVVDAAVHIGWYEIGVYERVHETLERVHGSGDLALMRELGHFCADKDLTTVHRLFSRMASPAFLLSKYAEFWRRYQDTGDWHVHKEGDRKLRAELVDWASTSEATCTRLCAYIEKFLDICGAKGARAMRTRCRARGDDRCEYTCEWQAGHSF